MVCEGGVVNESSGLLALCYIWYAIVCERLRADHIIVGKYYYNRYFSS